MNTAEHIVEAYFRLYEKCFTIPDVKVRNGNNRQLDLLAHSPKNRTQFHVESGVTHRKQFAPDAEKLREKIRYKFFGFPRPKKGHVQREPATPTHLHQIESTYRDLGLSPRRIRRVWVCWAIRPEHLDDVKAMLDELKQQHELEGRGIEILSFRDDILAGLLKRIKTANYEDVTLRTMSFIRQFDQQRHQGLTKSPALFDKHFGD